MPRGEKFFQKIIEYCFKTLFFLVPLILTPFNFELFEFNKMLTVYFLTALIVFGWLGKMIIRRQFIFRRSFWDIPLLFFLFSQFLSFYFSVDRHTSFWGYYSRFNGGLLSLICYSLLYWAFISNLNFPIGSRLLRIILITAFLVASYGIAEHFGIDAHLWVQDVRNRVFSTLGQPNWLAAWLGAIIPLSWSLALNFKRLNSKTPDTKRFKYFKIKILNLLSISNLGFWIFSIYYLCLLYTRSRSGFSGLAVAYIVFWLLTFLNFRKNLKKFFPKFLILTSLFLFITFLTDYSWIPFINKLSFSFKSHPSQTTSSLPPSSQTVTPPLLISESGDIRKVVWRGAIEIWRHYPLFGTGPETFAYSYYWHRPREHNDLSEWDFLYNKAHNEYLNYAACTGTVGLIAYLFLIGLFVFWSLIKIFKKENLENLEIKNSLEIENLNTINFRIALLAGFIAIVVSNFFGFSVVPVQILFFLFPAFAVILSNSKNHLISFKTSPQIYLPSSLSFRQKGLIFFIAILTFYFLLFVINYWRADYFFAQAEKLNKTGQYHRAFSLLQKAISLRSFEPAYHDELAWGAANLAVLAHKQKNEELTDKFTQLAKEESQKALKASPYHLNFWKTKAKVEWKLAEINPQYYQSVEKTLSYATSLAPTEPKIKYNLGLIYTVLGENSQAIKILEETIVLKPNYEDARFALALLYEQNGEIEKARQQWEYILEKINPQSQRVKEKLENLPKK